MITKEQQQRLNRDYLKALGRVPSSLDLPKSNEYYNDPVYDAMNRALLHEGKHFDRIRDEINRVFVIRILQYYHHIGKMTNNLTGTILRKYPCVCRGWISQRKKEIREADLKAA